MTGKDLVAPNPVHQMITQKDYAIEMVNLIIKEKNLDLFGEYSLEDLGASSLFDLSRVCLCHLYDAL